MVADTAEERKTRHAQLAEKTNDLCWKRLEWERRRGVRESVGDCGNWQLCALHWTVDCGDPDQERRVLRSGFRITRSLLCCSATTRLHRGWPASSDL